ncbi:DEAD/DEAH box helicase [Polymorphum gilvum]|uniref:DEAD/DEAH box helicase domain-containing protein n=1 Tax=Polymorphum gilvum (strain LMG 25793 / CGMCC 1.9160 / SL003B-26A1) TaxID=991905 RepID=F2IXM9_POLGS|nr:DEAD/DEAH box helicase [Polymorphum gilvum]ADZ71652.1 DEAD/DEAH box helicase domain-containing protein [Polymorphum gilvum SL003B-26A1]
MIEQHAVAPALAAALAKRGYTSLTPVQETILAQAPAEADLLVSAQTGSGKTVAFGLALAPTLLGDADRLGAAGAPLALAIAPTRELALQVKAELTWLYEEAGAQTASCVGGMDPRSERRALERGTHIVVGTPGRLRDHIERGALDLSQLRAVVLDEADEMLDLGFREDLEFILDAAPEDRRTLMFSATVPKPIADLARRFQKDAVRLSTISAREQHGDIDYFAHPVAPNERENAIINVLRFYEADKAIVFCSTREAVRRLTSRLANRGFSVAALSGELSQNERTHALQAMRDGRARVCVATDVAARGIDLPNLDLVIHADLPTGKAGLLHRSGRTGRAGRKGSSVLIVPFPRRRAAERLLLSADVKAAWSDAPAAAAIRDKDKARLLADPVLTEPAEEEDLALARELLSEHGPERIAAAFVRLHQSGLPAPEDLTEGGADDIRGRSRGERAPFESGPSRAFEVRNKFEDGIWFRLSLGHKHKADPRWLLPMICRAGHVTKREVGAIKIGGTETLFEIAGSHAHKYADIIRREGSGERGVVIEPVDVRGGRAPALRTEHDDEDRPSRYERARARAPERGFEAPRKPARRRRFDDEPAPTHPAFAPLSEAPLDTGERRARPSKAERQPQPGDGDGGASPERKKPAAKAAKGAAGKKAARKKGPSRAERKATKAKS